MMEMYIHKDGGVEGLLLTLLQNGYQVLFDNDGEISDYYWIKITHPKWTESFFVELNEDEYVKKLTAEEYEDIDEALRALHSE